MSTVLASSGSCTASGSVYSSEHCTSSIPATGSYHYPAESYEMGNYDYVHEMNTNYEGGGMPMSASGIENVAPPYCNASMPQDSNSCMIPASTQHGMTPLYGGYAQQPFLPLEGYHNSYMDSTFRNCKAGVVLGPNGKPKRKRVATLAQRRAANIRERRRMFNLNEAFDELRKRVPTFAYEKRLSRIETLRLAITYISFMSDVVEGKDPTEVKLNSKKGVNWLPLKKAAVTPEKGPASPLSTSRSTGN